MTECWLCLTHAQFRACEATGKICRLCGLIDLTWVTEEPLEEGE